MTEGRSRAAALAAGSYAGVLLLASSDTAVRFLLGPYLVDEQRMAPWGVGTLAAMIPVAALLVRLPAGAVYSARRGTALLLSFGGFATACVALLAVATAPWVIALLLVGAGIGWSVCTTVQLAALVGARAEAGNLSMMGWYAAVTSLGHASGTAAFGVLAETFGYRACFLVIAGMQVAGILLALPDTMRTARAGDRSPAERSTSDGGRQVPPMVWAGALLMFYINLLTGVVQTFYPLLAASHGVTLTQAGFLLSAMSVASTAIRLVSAVAARADRGPGLTLALVLASTAATAVLPFGLDVLPWQLSLFVLMGASRGLLRVTGSAQAFDAVRGRDRGVGLASALLFAGLDLGKVAAPLLAGGLAAVLGLVPMFSVSAAVCLAAYVGFRRLL